MTLDRLQATWPYVRSELLRPLFRQFENEHEDLVVAVVRTLLVRPAGMRRILQQQGVHTSLDQVLADRDTYIDSATDARTALARIKPSFFLSGRAVAQFLAELPEAFGEYDNPLLTQAYTDRLGAFVDKHMLPYRLDINPVRLTPLFPADLETHYRRLKDRIKDDAHLSAALRSFENAWNKQKDEWDQENGGRAILSAVQLAEGVSKAATGNQDETLGKALSRMVKENRFPSNNMSAILQNAYDFTNKYPNIRHVPGDPSCVRRELLPADVLVSALVFVGFSGVFHDICEVS